MASFAFTVEGSGRKKDSCSLNIESLWCESSHSDLFLCRRRSRRASLCQEPNGLEATLMIKLIIPYSTKMMTHSYPISKSRNAYQIQFQNTFWIFFHLLYFYWLLPIFARELIIVFALGSVTFITMLSSARIRDCLINHNACSLLINNLIS